MAEWQTRWLQVPVSFGTWGFKSPFAHHEQLESRTAAAAVGMFPACGFFHVVKHCVRADEHAVRLDTCEVNRLQLNVGNVT